MGLELDVTPDVLVPRPETELVLERALVLARERGATVLADVGTGSGAIAIALALADPDNRVYATDSSEAALSVGRRNIEKHGVAGRVHLLAGNLLAPIAERPELIVANLPYLSDEMMATMDQDVLHEPVLALHGGRTGLEPYRELFRQMVEREWMVPAVLEIDPRQAGEMRMLAGEFFCGGNVEVERDYAGHDRIAVIEP
jgi:release factor glutamine methyltransferase